ncbi:MAG: outer membrane protein assembly factor BamA [Kiritimatiellia bacterium]
MKLFLLCSFLTFCSALFAVRVTVGDVQVRADDHFDVDPTESVLAQCSVQKGQTDEQANIQNAVSNDVKELLATPNYSKVDASLGVNDNGEWVVIYTVARRPQLAAEPAITGLNGAIREGKARDAMKLKSNDRIDDTLAAAAAARIRDELRNKDYPDATVSYEIRYAETPGYAYLSFIAEAGTERNIRNYSFEGNTTFDHDTLAGTFGWVPFYNPLGWFRDYPVTAEKLDDARATINAFYVNAGYLDAEVSTAEIRPTSDKSADYCDVVFTIKEGPRYDIGSITVEGAKTYPNDILIQTGTDVLKDRGEKATDETLTAIQTAIEDYYGSRGYVDTFATLQKVGRSDGAAIIDLKFTITEGERIRIGRIEIRGNTVTQDKVIRRELVIQPGEEYDVRLVNRSEARVQNLNYFLPKSESGVTSYTVKTPDAGVRDLVFNVREQATGDYGFGVGVSTIDSVFVFAKATQNNFDLFNPSNGFRGGGQRASVEVEFGGRRQTIETSWTQPWLFDMPLSFTIDAYRKMRWYDHYDQITTGAAFTWSWKPMAIPLPWGSEFQPDRIGLRYTLEKIEYDDPEKGIYYRGSDGRRFCFADEKDGINSKIRVFWSENHRNHPFFPTAGWESNLYAELGVLGDAKDYGFGWNASKWWDLWFDHVLLTRFRFDTVDAYNDDVPMFDRYFIGGGRTIRGFEYRDGGPKAYGSKGRNGDHVAIGGQTLWCGTVEYSVPIVSMLRLAVFSDIGTVGEDFMDFGGDLLWSAGIGLRLDLPKFPIRLDFATPIVNDDDTNEEVFTFWIGID